MSNTVLIIGESGTGKSTSIRNLNPQETFVINVIDKPLPFRGFKKNYSVVSEKGAKGNYFATDNYSAIMKLIEIIDKSRPEITNLIIDDFQYVMCNEFMRRSNEKGYQKFTEIGHNAWDILSKLSSCRDGLDRFVLSHSESDSDGKSKCKTIGKMLDATITVEGMFTIVFHTILIDGTYKFLTAHDGNHVAKSPMGMFTDKYIDNDLALIKQKMAEYFEGDL